MKKTVKGLPDWKGFVESITGGILWLYPVSIVSNYRFRDVSFYYVESLGVNYSGLQTKSYPIDERTNEEFINLVTLGIVELFLDGDCEIC